MSQAILISDNEVINSLYEVNLRAYVATNVTIKNSLDGAIKLIEQSPNIDVVICYSELTSKENSLGQLQKYFEEKGLRIPIIVLGESKKKVKNAINITNKYDIQSLLRAMAKVLQITAQEMANKPVPDHFPIPVKLFSQIKNSPCDIFYRREKDDFEFEYYKILEGETTISDKLNKYLDEGVTHLYIPANFRLKFINQASTVVIQELNRDDLNSAERVEITSQGMGIVAEQIFIDEKISTEVAQISIACAASIEKVAKDIPKLKNLLTMLLENKSDYVFKHSVLSTFIATNIIKKISWGSKEQAEKVAFSLFFHDIYLVPIYKKYPDALSEEDLLFRDDVEEMDKKIVLEHASLAGQLVKTFPRCPMGADMIVTQHHGMTNGQGFAVNFKDDVSPLAKIIIISEDIAANILITLKSTGADPSKAKFNIPVICKLLNDRYKAHSYRKIIEAFSLVDIL